MATRRPDLEAVEFKRPPYIGGVIAPVMLVTGKAGTYYYADLQSEGTASSGRSAGTAPTATTLTESNSTFSCAEKYARYNIDEAAKELYGGLGPVEIVMAKRCMRAVGKVNEAEVAAVTLVNASATATVDILNDLIGAVGTAATAVADLAAGKIAFVASSRILRRIKKYAEVIDRMKHTSVIPDSSTNVRGISNELLATVLGVDLVLEGNDADWYTASATYQTRAAVVVLPDPGADMLEEPQFARLVTHRINDQGNQWLVESYHDDNLVADVVQCREWISLENPNPELVYILTGIDELNASSTTTSTTT